MLKSISTPVFGKLEKGLYHMSKADIDKVRKAAEDKLAAEGGSGAAAAAAPKTPEAASVWQGTFARCQTANGKRVGEQGVE